MVDLNSIAGILSEEAKKEEKENIEEVLTNEIIEQIKKRTLAALVAAIAQTNTEHPKEFVERTGLTEEFFNGMAKTKVQQYIDLTGVMDIDLKEALPAIFGAAFQLGFTFSEYNKNVEPYKGRDKVAREILGSLEKIQEDDKS